MVPQMSFEQLLDRVRDRVRLKVCNGEITERGLARRVGLSQSHIHNVLSGVRALTPSTADRILTGLGMALEDLLVEGELPRMPPERAVLNQLPWTSRRIL